MTRKFEALKQGTKSQLAHEHYLVSLLDYIIEFKFSLISQGL